MPGPGRPGRAAAPRSGSGRRRRGSADGSGSRSAGSPGRGPRPAAPRAACPVPSAVGIAAISASVYGCCGCAQTSRVGPSSTIVPRYMTETSSAMWRTIARSCEIRSSARSSSRASVDEQVRDLGLGRGVEGGERLVEHDHRGVGGERAGDRDPLPLAAAELVRVAARRRSRASRPARAAPRRGCSAPRGRARPPSRSPSPICEPTVRRGFSDEYGFWKTICSFVSCRGARAAAERRQRDPVEDDLAGRRLDQADDRAGERGLAAARLADEPGDPARARARGSRRRLRARRGPAAGR